MSNSGHQGLFAFDGDDFYWHFQDNHELDHAAWFKQVGLPESGPGYDALLRGKVNDDIDTGQITVGFYGTAYLSNRRYKKIVDVFKLDEERIVEQMLNEAY